MLITKVKATLGMLIVLCITPMMMMQYGILEATLFGKLLGLKHALVVVPKVAIGAFLFGQGSSMICSQFMLEVLRQYQKAKQQRRRKSRSRRPKMVWTPPTTTGFEHAGFGWGNYYADMSHVEAPMTTVTTTKPAIGISSIAVRVKETFGKVQKALASTRSNLLKLPLMTMEMVMPDLEEMMKSSQMEESKESQSPVENSKPKLVERPIIKPTSAKMAQMTVTDAPTNGVSGSQYQWYENGSGPIGYTYTKPNSISHYGHNGSGSYSYHPANATENEAIGWSSGGGWDQGWTSSVPSGPSSSSTSPVGKTSFSISQSGSVLSEKSVPLKNDEYTKLMAWAKGNPLEFQVNSRTNNGTGTKAKIAEQGRFHVVSDQGNETYSVIKITKMNRRSDTGSENLSSMTQSTEYHKFLAETLKDIGRFFWLVSLFDGDKCLQKLVCDIHAKDAAAATATVIKAKANIGSSSGRRSDKLNLGLESNSKPWITLSAYEQHVVDAFKVLEKLITHNNRPDIEGSSSGTGDDGNANGMRISNIIRTYRKAALIGRYSSTGLGAGDKTNSCNAIYSTCKYSTDFIISMSNKLLWPDIVQKSNS